MTTVNNNRLGVDLVNTLPATIYGSTGTLQRPPHKLGEQVWGDDGKFYVFAQANATIAASTAVAAVSPTTFLAIATTGAYLSPATAMVTGDYGWFAKASV